MHSTNVPTWATCRDIVSFITSETLSQCTIYKRIRQEKRATIMYWPLNMQETAAELRKPQPSWSNILELTNCQPSCQISNDYMLQLSWQLQNWAKRVLPTAELTSGSWADKWQLSWQSAPEPGSWADTLQWSWADTPQPSWHGTAELTDRADRLQLSLF